MGNDREYITVMGSRDAYLQLDSLTLDKILGCHARKIEGSDTSPLAGEEE